MDDGSAYIAPTAALLKGAWAVKGERGTLTVVDARSAEFTRGQTRATVHGQAVELDLPRA